MSPNLLKSRVRGVINDSGKPLQSIKSFFCVVIVMNDATSDSQ